MKKLQFIAHFMLATSALIAGCAGGHSARRQSVDAHGATLRIISEAESKSVLAVRLELKNRASTAFVYEHWMSRGPEPVPHCRDPNGRIRICAPRIYVMADAPYVHESYLQPGDSVKFDAVPSKDEEVGVKYWIEGKEDYLWLPLSQIPASHQKAE